MRAFGLDLVGDLDLPFQPAVATIDSPVPVRLVLLGTDEPWGRAWPDGAVTVLREIIYTDGSVAMRFERDETGSVLMQAAGYGEHLVWPEGTQVVSRPDRDGHPWGWQRLLIAQVLPLVAALRGHELLHASAVADDQGALAFAGASGSGKSSIALAMAVEGLELLADDVLALSTTPDGSVMAHPGAASMAMRATERELVALAGRTGLALPVERGEKDYVRTRMASAPRPLRVLLALERNADTSSVRLERVESPDLHFTLQHAYSPTVANPSRLATQLAVHAAFGRWIDVVRLRIPAATTPRSVAVAVLEQL